MKKFVLITDGKNFSVKTFEFIRDLYEKEPFLLVGAFFHSINYQLVVANAFAPGPTPHMAYTKQEHEEYESVINQFKILCRQHNVEHRVHRQGDEWDIAEMSKETRFADAIFISGQLFFADIEPGQPNRFMRKIFKHAECPVLVIPENVRPIEKIAVAYNGKKESMFALKAFCDVFPSLTNLPTQIFYWVNKTDEEVPDMEYLNEYASRHFPNLNFRVLFFDPAEYLATWADTQKNTLFICGSYHHSTLSSLFRKSFVEAIINKHSAPVFIAHSN